MHVSWVDFLFLFYAKIDSNRSIIFPAAKLIILFVFFFFFFHSVVGRGHHHRVGSWAYEANNPSRYTHILSSCSSPDLTYPEDRRVVEPPLIIVRNKPHVKPPRYIYLYIYIYMSLGLYYYYYLFHAYNDDTCK